MRFNRDPGRSLTEGERGLAREMFGAALDPDRARIHRAKWWWFQPKNVVMAPDGGIWFHPEGGLWCADFADAPIHLQALFVHELTHVWQAQRHGRWYLPFARHPFCRYRYLLRPGRPLERYGIEQQGEIVRHAFLARLAGTPNALLDELLAQIRSG